MDTITYNNCKIVIVKYVFWCPYLSTPQLVQQEATLVTFPSAPCLVCHRLSNKCRNFLFPLARHCLHCRTFHNMYRVETVEHLTRTGFKVFSQCCCWPSSPTRQFGQTWQRTHTHRHMDRLWPLDGVSQFRHSTTWTAKLVNCFFVITSRNNLTKERCFLQALSYAMLVQSTICSTFQKRELSKWPPFNKWAEYGSQSTDWLTAPVHRHWPCVWSHA